MITLTGFADEISPDLKTQLDTLASEQIAHLELRGVWGKNVLKLSEEELDVVQAALEQKGIRVSSIGSPLGKIKISDDFAPHYEDAKRAVLLAKRFGAPYIRIFSFLLPQDEAASGFRPEVIERMKRLTELAEKSGVVLLHENEKHIYGDTAERCLDILQACDSPGLRAAFDPANFVQCQVKPMTVAFPLLEPYIEYIHVKDAVWATGKVVPAGEGDGQLGALVAKLAEKRYSGFMSLEPHLKAVNAFEGFSGPELFGVASKALKRLLADANVNWN